ncbi:hypothetical protein MMPV_004443 [Pyropia vietnamensis]
MASLADQFLADVGDSDDSASDGGAPVNAANRSGDGGGGKGLTPGGTAPGEHAGPIRRAGDAARSSPSTLSSAVHVGGPAGGGVGSAASTATATPFRLAPSTANPDSVLTPAGTLDDTRLQALLERVAPLPPSGGGDGEGGPPSPPPPADYALVSAAVAATAAVDSAIASADAALRAAYAPRFPELDTLLPSPGPYAAVVAALGNDPSPRVDLAPALPSSAAVITVHLAAASTAGVPLSSADAAAVAAGAARVGELDAARSRLTAFVTSAAGVVAPNLCALVGEGLAAALLAATHVGGAGASAAATGGGVEVAPGVADGGRLRALASMPACNVQVVGAAGGAEAASTGALLGDAAAALRHRGLIYASPLVRALPPHLHARAGRTLAAKVSLAARLDLHRRPSIASVGAGAGAPQPDAGAGGAKLRAAVEAKFAEWTTPPPRRTAKPLPVPDSAPSRRRGGKRARRAKELYGVSDIGRAASRLAFGGDGAGSADAYGRAELEDVEDGVAGGGDGTGAGLLRLRLAVRSSETLAKAVRRRLGEGGKRKGGGSGVRGRATATAPPGGAAALSLGAATPMPGAGSGVLPLGGRRFGTAATSMSSSSSSSSAAAAAAAAAAARPSATPAAGASPAARSGVTAFAPWPLPCTSAARGGRPVAAVTAAVGVPVVGTPTGWRWRPGALFHWRREWLGSGSSGSGGSGRDVAVNRRGGGGGGGGSGSDGGGSPSSPRASADASPPLPPASATDDDVDDGPFSILGVLDFVTQRAIQTYLFYRRSFRDSVTADWVEAATGLGPLGEVHDFVFRGTDGYLRALGALPPRTYIGYDVAVSPPAVVAALCGVREGVATEVVADLGRVGAENERLWGAYLVGVVRPEDVGAGGSSSSSGGSGRGSAAGQGGGDDSNSRSGSGSGGGGGKRPHKEVEGGLVERSTLPVNEHDPSHSGRSALCGGTADLVSKYVTVAAVWRSNALTAGDDVSGDGDSGVEGVHEVSPPGNDGTLTGDAASVPPSAAVDAAAAAADTAAGAATEGGEGSEDLPSPPPPRVLPGGGTVWGAGLDWEGARLDAAWLRAFIDARGGGFEADAGYHVGRTFLKALLATPPVIVSTPPAETPAGVSPANGARAATDGTNALASTTDAAAAAPATTLDGSAERPDAPPLGGRGVTPQAAGSRMVAPVPPQPGPPPATGFTW